MATLKACVRRPRKDGFWQVYIRVTHKRNVGFIKTEKMINTSGLTKTKDIKDAFVLRYCADLIIKYNELLNKIDINPLNVNQVIDYLTTEDSDVCFSDFARQHIRQLINNGHERNARNYELALGHLVRWVQL